MEDIFAARALESHWLNVFPWGQFSGRVSCVHRAGSAVAMMLPATSYRRRGWGRRLLVAAVLLLVYQAAATMLSNAKPDSSTLTDSQGIYTPL